MGYQAPTWVNNGAPPLNAKNMQDISDNLAYVSNNMVNPNLLDNWYFGNPVNQRGQTSYTSAGYAIDRWMLSTADGHAVISDGSLEIFSPRQYGAYLSQTIETALTKSLAGQVVTASVLAAAGDEAFSFNLSKDDVYVNSFTIYPNTVSSMTFTIPTGATKISWMFAGNAAGYVRPIAVKLELGPQQTLAHQENGKWVLNEIPDYGEQLRRCQRYLVDIAGKYPIIQSFGASGSWFSIQLPCDMRTTPSFITQDVSKVHVLRVGNYVPEVTFDWNTASFASGRTIIVSSNLSGQFADCLAIDSRSVFASAEL